MDETAWDKDLFQVERAHAGVFGLMKLSTHVNGYVGQGADLRIWVGKRSKDKDKEPGMFDNMVAGGLPTGLSPCKGR